MNSLIQSLTLLWDRPFWLANIGLTILIFMAVIFSLLVYRQSKRMNEVLPTPLAPWITALGIAYIITTAFACFLAIGIIVS